MLNIPLVCTAPYSKLSDEIYHLIEPPQRLFFSLFKEMDNMGNQDGEHIICYPDIKSKDPVIPGNVKLIIDDKDINDTVLTSIELTNPTWQDLLQTVNDMLGVADCQIGFLENIVPLDAGTYQIIFAH